MQEKKEEDHQQISNKLYEVGIDDRKRAVLVLFSQQSLY